MKKRFAPDKMSIYYLLALVIFLSVSIIVFPQDTGMIIIEAIVTLVFGALFIIGPNYYVADSEGIAIYYFLFVKDYYKWDDIKNIRECLEGHRKFYYTAYAFETQTIENKPLYMQGQITKSIWTKSLILKYWDGEIEGDDFEVFKKKLRKKKAEALAIDKKKAIKSENEAREIITEILRGYRATAKKQGQFIKAAYSYVVENSTYDKRPDKSYSFVVEIEMGKIGSPDDESEFIITELLFVRYGKNTIKVIPKDEKIYSEISQKVGEFVSL